MLQLETGDALRMEALTHAIKHLRARGKKQKLSSQLRTIELFCDCFDFAEAKEVVFLALRTLVLAEIEEIGCENEMEDGGDNHLPATKSRSRA